MYEKVLGQTINYEKSSFMINKNIDDRKAEALSKILGVKRTTTSDRNKSKIFQRVEDRVWKAL